MSESEFMLLDVDYSRRSRNQFLIRILVIGFAFVLGFAVISLIISSDIPLLKRPNFKTHCSKDYDYDFSLLTVRWPASLCSDKGCPKFEANKWLIHGLWPTYQNNSWPQFCCFDQKFVVKNLDPIRSELLINWPNLELNKTDDSLWEHEWTKHGTCTKTKQISYFNSTLNLFDNFPIYEWLKESQIIPSNDKVYSVQQFIDVFTDKLKHTVQLWCSSYIKTNQRKNVRLIEEIRICINHTNRQVIDCTEKSNCQQISYPESS